MKERVLEFITNTFQWCCHSIECQLLFRLWTYAMAAAIFWGFVELIFFGFEKVFEEDDVPAPTAPVKITKPTKAPRKTKKSSIKKKSIKKKSKK